MRIRALAPLILAAALAAPAAAQDRSGTIADMRAELSALAFEMRALRSELLAGGAPALQAAGGEGALARMDAIEAALTRLTARTEELGNRIDRIVADGTNRIGDLEFRLCELEEGCDIADLPITASLGGGETPRPAPAPAPVPAPGGAAVPQLALSERADFDAAKAALDAGNAQEAADRFARFTETYTGGPLTADAQFLRGEALAELGETASAARAYLDAFSGAPDGPRAAESLLRLGQTLGELGQVQEACVTLSEVGLRFAQSPAAAEAAGSMQALGCQ